MALIWSESCDEIIGVGWSAWSNGSSNEGQITGGIPDGDFLLLDDRYTGDSDGKAWYWSGTTLDQGATKVFGVADHDNVLIYGVAYQLHTGSTLANGSARPLLTVYSDNGSLTEPRLTVYIRRTDVAGLERYDLEVRDGLERTGVVDNTLRASASAVIFRNSVWAYLEVKFVIHGSTGSIVARINETEVINVTGIDTDGGFAGTNIGAVTQWIPATVTNGGTSSFPLAALDDIYFCNGKDGVNDAFLGDVRVIKLRPNAAGSVSDWAPSTGTDHWANVDNLSHTSTPYNSSSTDEQAEDYNMEALPASATSTVFGVVQKTAMYETFAQVGVATTIHDGASETENAERALSVALPGFGISVYTEHHDTKPSGGAWDIATVNAMRCGVRIKSIT